MSKLPESLAGQPFFAENVASAELGAVLRYADKITVSADPAVVFGSLAEICISLFCDSCIVSLVRADGTPFIGYWPRTNLEAARADTDREQARCELKPVGRPAGSQGSDDSVFVPISAVPVGDDPASGYCGVFTFILHERQPTLTHAVLARLLVDRAMAIIATERLRQESADHADKADNLQIALKTSRTVGMAMGIVMERHKLSPDQAFNLLGRISQHARRKVREVADEVVATGELRIPAGVRLVERARVPAPGPQRAMHRP